MCAGMCVQAHNQAKSSATSALVKAQAGKEQKEQEVAELHHALEEANRKLQVSAPLHTRPQSSCPWHTLVVLLKEMSLISMCCQTHQTYLNK